MADPTLAIPAAAPRAPITRAQIAGVTLGNALEFYDFLVFAFFAVQIGRSFFPAADPQTSLLATLATFGAGFITRPVGAVVIGRLGDRVGRKPMMLLCFAMIGVANLGLAITPSYAAIGLAAPIAVLVLRLVQGFALGGEVGPSTAFLVEASPPGRRGTIVAMQYVGQGLATLAAGVVGVTLAAVSSPAALDAWGWRVAVGLGVLIVPIGLRLRGSLEETLEPRLRDEPPPPPLADYRRIAIFAFLTLLAATIVTYVLNYMTTYAVATLAMPPGVSLGATVANGLANAVGALIAGVLSDRHGRRALMIWPMTVLTVAIIPAFWLLDATRTPWTLWSVTFVLRFGLSLAATAALVYVAERLPPRVRAGALSIIYAVAISIFGGSTQFVVAWLTGVTGNPLAPAWYMLAAALVGLVTMLAMAERDGSARLMPSPAR